MSSVLSLNARPEEATTPPQIVAVPVDPALIGAIWEENRAREDVMRAQLRLLLQIKAIERRRARLEAEGQPQWASLDVTIDHLQEAADVMTPHRRARERRMEQLAKQLPVWPWVESIRGFGALGLAQIVGECGDLSGYASPAKVWKRMGVAVMEGERQRLVMGGVQGYVPRRRSILFNIGESLIKGNQEGPYRTLYLARKDYERERLGPEAPQIHVHNRARRYMEKRLLRDLWRAWRAQPS